MKKIILVLMLCLIGFTSLANAEEFIVHNQSKSCSDISELDRALSSSEKYFSDWTDDNFDEAVHWAENCVDSGFQFAGPYRVKSIRNYQKKVRNNEAHLAANAEEKKQHLIQERERNDAEALAQKIAADKKLSEEEASKKMDDCIITNNYLLYDAQEKVIADLDNEQTWKNSVAYQRNVNKISGVRDLSVDYNNAEFIIQVREDLKQDWKRYKEYGGKEKSPRNVTHKYSDPCAQYATNSN